MQIADVLIDEETKMKVARDIAKELDAHKDRIGITLQRQVCSNDGQSEFLPGVYI